MLILFCFNTRDKFYHDPQANAAARIFGCNKTGYNKIELFNFLIASNLINEEIYCPKCNNELKVNRSNLLFRCRKVLYEKNKHKKYVKKQYDFKASAKVDMI